MFSDWNNLVQTVLAYWAALQAKPEWALGAAILAIAGFAARTLKPVAALAKWNRARRGQALASNIAAKTHVQSFSDADIVGATANYVEPDCSNVDPANERDIRRVVGVREPVFSSIDRALDAESKNHIMVLADSGMGKTTFLLNYFAREQERSVKRRRPMALVPLGRADALDQIKAVLNKRTTLLLADALDEDVVAIQDYRKRVDQLMNAASDFKAVILTCRTQFFASDSAIPMETGIARVSPRRAGRSGTHEFRKVYLMPFTEEQIRLYVRRMVPWWRPKRRAKATAIVQRIPELSVRPMLLALLPELMEDSRNLRELWELYEFMVDSWLQRESNWIDPSQLMEISQLVAVDLFTSRTRRKAERISPDELASLLATSAESIEQWKLTTRSLLNRDAGGRFKFAHRSIMEFLFVRAFIKGKDTCASVEWTDMMCDLFLSFGRSRAAQTVDGRRQLEHVLSHVDLSETGLFPVVPSGEAASAIDMSWARNALRDTGTARHAAGIPTGWRKHTSRYRVEAEVVRMHEFAEGLAWEFVNTTQMQDRGEREVYRVGRSADLWGDENAQWTVPTLSEFRSLLESLQAHERDYLDDRELYWLRDQDGANATMARVRRADIPGLVAEQSFPDGVEHLFTGQVGESECRCAVDVYRVPKLHFPRGLQGAGSHQAQPIKTFRGDALALWNDMAPARIASNELDQSSSKQRGTAKTKRTTREQ